MSPDPGFCPAYKEVGEVWERPGSDLVIPPFPIRVGAEKHHRVCRGGASMREHAGEAPAVFCPACGKPMTPSEPIPVTNRMSEIVYRCDACDATTLRTVKAPVAEPGRRRGVRER
jgi:hypothetical protein